MPTRDRGLSCMVIVYEGSQWFFDCGEGSQRAVLNSGLGLNKECSFFITHLHGDHVIGLLGILQSMAMNKREKPVKVFGPKGIIEFITMNRAILRFGLTFEVEIKEVRPGVIFDEKKSKVRVLAARSEHSTLSFSFLFEEKEKPGRFHPETALKLGIPEGPLWSELQHGQTVKSPKTGKKVTPNQVMDSPRMGKRIGLSGDTRPSKSLEQFFKKCDVLIFDSTYSDANKENAIENYHSTSREAAILARRAGIKKLILTHFSARYRNVSHLVREAREEFPNTIAAKDMMVYDLSAAS
ncbi:MAG: ribonuclease Z [Thaumarchaeota archaeon]|nr:ribonuclease Z [Nitrososphaerota archaeon]